MTDPDKKASFLAEVDRRFPKLQSKSAEEIMSLAKDWVRERVQDGHDCTYVSDLDLVQALEDSL